MDLNIEVKKFSELSLTELYDILQLRSEVFVVEQDCVYQDIDGKDNEALHIIGFKEDEIVAYTRCFKPGYYFEEAAIGRVVVKDLERKFGYGHEIMKASDKAIKEHYKTSNIKLSAQQYLIKFYESHGYQTTGEGYLEDGIPHIGMIKD
ncbi:GNAT family N-acetyltransferase [Christiangramia forsetii]|uniref:ElaA-like GNAT family acetyltransferase n=2 Tax=Christiangramia forsetii TaxID=411153 RepID=A0M6L2_CHRFK|nr:GNAT family N-acetyltransferase [Christiangramia forsetii]GGG30115.1 ElaA protein [Christiangramia forsetii]CAL68257.1 ElaA-like GNAT family acetyltransferase [Christiangramia forsetii KT0803]